MKVSLEIKNVHKQKMIKVDNRDDSLNEGMMLKEPNLNLKKFTQLRQTQGPAPDPKCKLIISSLLTLPHLLDCLIFTRNAMSIVLLLQILGGWNRWGVVDLY